MISSELVKTFRQRRKAAAVVAVVLIALIIGERWRNGDALSEPSWYVNAAAALYLISYVTACFYHLKSRQRSAGWLLLLPTGIVALIIYACLEDRSQQPDNIPCTVCSAANFPDDKLCRLCKSPLRAGPSPQV